MANDVLKKVEGNLECHSEFLNNLENSKRWIENAREIIRECSDTSASSKKEHLETNLESIKVATASQIGLDILPLNFQMISSEASTDSNNIILMNLELGSATR